MKTGLNHAVRMTVAALSIVLGLNAAVPAAAQCPGDVVATGGIDGTDLAAVLGAWGTNGQGALVTDLDGDGIVNGADLAVILSGWGPCPTAAVPPWATLVEAAPNPAIVTSASLRAAIVATGLAWRVKDSATDIEMVLIPPGTFQMGCSASQQFGCYSVEFPIHDVTLTHAFYLGRYEVTQSQWESRMGSNPSQFQSTSAEVPADQIARRPVERVTWNMIQGFLGPAGMRLPTSAEWEFAYRAGTTTAFHGYPGNLNGTNDDSLLGNVAWFSTNQTRPVGGRLGNGFGLHDMAGNVWEWVNDWWGDYSPNAQTNPTGPTSGTRRVLRGGGWDFNSNNCRSSTRNNVLPDYTYSNVGFRVARTP